MEEIIKAFTNRKSKPHMILMGNGDYIRLDNEDLEHIVNALAVYHREYSWDNDRANWVNVKDLEISITPLIPPKRE